MKELIAVLQKDDRKIHLYIGWKNQQPIGAAMPVAKRLANTTGKVMIRLADIFQSKERFIKLLIEPNEKIWKKVIPVAKSKKFIIIDYGLLCSFFDFNKLIIVQLGNSLCFVIFVSSGDMANHHRTNRLNIIEFLIL